MHLQEDYPWGNLQGNHAFHSFFLVTPPLLLPQEQAPLACSRLLVKEHCEGPSLQLGAVELLNGV